MGEHHPDQSFLEAPGCNRQSCNSVAQIASTHSAVMWLPAISIFESWPIRNVTTPAIIGPAASATISRSRFIDSLPSLGLYVRPRGGGPPIFFCSAGGRFWPIAPNSTRPTGLISHQLFGVQRKRSVERRPHLRNRLSTLAHAPRTRSSLGRCWRGAPERQSFQKFLNRPGASAV